MVADLGDADVCVVSDSSEWAPMDAQQAVTRLTVARWQDAAPNDVDDAVAQEVPIALVYNGISHVVMLATPADLEDFAYGFSFTEGIISARGQIYGVDSQALFHADGQLQGIELHISLAAEQFAALKAQRRNLTGRTGCGLCGAERLQQVFKPLKPAEEPGVAVSLKAIEMALSGLRAQQPLQQLTGATHATAIVDQQGQVLCVREDVGRHNALDKLIGSLLRQRYDFSTFWRQHWVLTTSRASYEMVQKVAICGGSALIALSAPTALAVQLARQYRCLLVGFAKSTQCVVYSGGLAPGDSHESYKKE
ncbi:formate dehydrogenase accessory sulfurtransferase FdhD [Methylophilus medardicus]|uniref:Sulfur carrier protein FdhD n=1 Tax=Methylophilus medardicus TaxID=2588534 RepID=A0A5B8CVY5_9PROT|nr:formate dehydrogenase accessory sulfurtransferase FdhD [Methylophilus medardicus]QDC45433.1 formate dehydrogenase accessory sulfurtransferase FdhD [Methylophilus medardicus]QDC50440.1 formate dehydrogenase accessory sulfurtransferase FdhD [Methylophilus medardicus]QDC54145.1 formate dehydrogenase accessory sulfurtransferase FdhD [Methylophilus medardicus]